MSQSKNVNVGSIDWINSCRFYSYVLSLNWLCMHFCFLLWLVSFRNCFILLCLCMVQFWGLILNMCNLSYNNEGVFLFHWLLFKLRHLWYNLFRVIMILSLDNGLILIHLMLSFVHTLGSRNYEYVIFVR